MDRRFRPSCNGSTACCGRRNGSPTPRCRRSARALVQAVLGLHGTGLERIVARLDEAGDAGRAILGACADDEVVGGLLLLHGLHPRDLDERVRQALDRVRPSLHKHGGEVELLEVGDGVVRLRLHADGCGSSAAAMRKAIEEALAGKAPEVTAVEIEGDAGEAAENGKARVPLPML